MDSENISSISTDVILLRPTPFLITLDCGSKRTFVFIWTLFFFLVVCNKCDDGLLWWRMSLMLSFILEIT